MTDWVGTAITAAGLLPVGSNRLRVITTMSVLLIERADISLLLLLHSSENTTLLTPGQYHDNYINELIRLRNLPTETEEPITNSHLADIVL